MSLSLDLLRSTLLSLSLIPTALTLCLSQGHLSATRSARSPVIRTRLYHSFVCWLISFAHLYLKLAAYLLFFYSTLSFLCPLYFSSLFVCLSLTTLFLLIWSVYSASVIPPWALGWVWPHTLKKTPFELLTVDRQKRTSKKKLFDSRPQLLYS